MRQNRARAADLGLASVTWLFSVGILLGAQGATSAPVKSAVVGVVIDQLTNQPVPDVVVSVWGAADDVVTDESGRFVIRNLPEKPFTIRVEGHRGGGLAKGIGAFGQTRWDSEPQYISVRSGQAVRDLRIPFWRYGVIAGRVTDEAGQPLAGAALEVLHPGSAAGRRRVVQPEHDHNPIATDADGRFRILHEPGQVFLRVAANGWREASEDQRGRVETRVYPAMYFPDARRPEDAKLIQVEPGTVATTDVRLRAQPGFQMTGIVVANGSPVRGAQVFLSDDDQASSVDGIRQFSVASQTDSRGLFVMHGVPAGDYLLTAATPSSVRSDTDRMKQLMSRVRVSVADQPVNVDLELRPLPILRGRFVFDGSTKPMIERGHSLAMIALDPSEQRGWENLRVIDADPSQPLLTPAPTVFSLAVEPGRHVLQLDEALEGWMLRSIELGGRDITDAPIDVNTDISDIVVTLTDRLTKVTVKITARPSRPVEGMVCVFPSDPARWVDLGPWPAATAERGIEETGDVTFEKLPPGEYFAVALSYQDARKLSDARAVRAAAQLASRFSLAEGETRSLSLEIVSLPPDEEAPWKPETPRSSAPPARIRPGSDSLPFAAEATGAIAGIVVASDTNEPVANALVYVYEWNRGRSVDDALHRGVQDTAWVAYGRRDLGSAAVLTSVDGTFTLTSLAAGRYRLRATAPGFGAVDVPFVDWLEGRPDVSAALTVTAGATTTVKRVALPHVASLAGVVRDDRGRPIVDAGILIQTASGRTLMEMRTDEKGRYAAGGLQPGAFTLTAQVIRRDLPITSEADLTEPMKRFNPAPVIAGNYVKANLDLKPREAKNLDFTVKLTEKAGAPVSGSRK